MSLPFIKFYTKDWQGDNSLRTCSIAARGLWIEMLCIMNCAERRGYLETKKQVPLTEEIVSRLTGVDKGEVNHLTTELIEAGVVSIEDNTGIIYSRRMVNDDEKSKNGRKFGQSGGNPKLLPVQPPTPPNKENIDILDIRSHISITPPLKGGDSTAAAMVEEIINCRPEFNRLPQEPFFLAIHTAGDNPRLKQNHDEFIKAMVNCLKLPKVPVNTYATYLRSSGPPVERGSAENYSQQEYVMSSRKRPVIS